MSIVEQSCDLLIVGGGYSAISALNAATHYLPKHARVVVVAKERAWGGMWVDSYDFVRLHTPYQSFTTGERKWEIAKPAEYLATKKEILSHFENIRSLCVTEKELDLIELFSYELVKHKTVQQESPKSNGENCEPAAYGGVDKTETTNTGSDIDKPQCKKVEVLIKPVQADNVDPLPSIKITADRMIMAFGLNFPNKYPLPLTSENVYSLAPSDVLTPEWNVRMRFAPGVDKSIWVIGSGKTAIDVIVHLCRTIPNARDRIRCVTGHGTWFMVRDAPSGFWERYIEESHTTLDCMIKMIDMYDGSNPSEVYSELGKCGLLHSALPDPEGFSTGVCSKAEIATAKAALSPAGQKVFKAYLKDVVDDGDASPMMQFCSLESCAGDWQNTSLNRVH